MMPAPHDAYTPALTPENFTRKRPLMRWALSVANQLLNSDAVHNTLLFETVELDKRAMNSAVGVVVVTSVDTRNRWLQLLTATNTKSRNTAQDRRTAARQVLGTAWLDDLLPTITDGLDFVLVTSKEFAEYDELIVQDRCSNLPSLAHIRDTAIDALLYKSV